MKRNGKIAGKDAHLKRLDEKRSKEYVVRVVETGGKQTLTPQFFTTGKRTYELLVVHVSYENSISGKVLNARGKLLGARMSGKDGAHIFNNQKEIPPEYRGNFFLVFPNWPAPKKPAKDTAPPPIFGKGEKQATCSFLVWDEKKQRWIRDWRLKKCEWSRHCRLVFRVS